MLENCDVCVCLCHDLKPLILCVCLRVKVGLLGHYYVYLLLCKCQYLNSRLFALSSTAFNKQLFPSSLQRPAGV